MAVKADSWIIFVSSQSYFQDEDGLGSKKEMEFTKAST